ncbi:MAG: tyrosine-type recombinase/integrase [Motiliproteus sp.]
MAGRSGMSALQTALTEYLCMRRALGFKLYDTGLCLQHFVGFTEAEGASFITTERAVRWAIQPTQASPAHWARRLGMVRQFAQYCCALEARTEIPPQGLLPHRYTRKQPYLYSDEEITRLLLAAKRLPSPGGLRALTYTTLLGLLAVSGLRISEPIALDRTDVDLIDGSLTIRGSKFGKSRWLPLHPSTRQALQDYAVQRDRQNPTALTPSFFISERGTRLTQCCVRSTFVKLSRQIGLRGSQDSFGPRLHDLRHGFAIRTLLNWYRSGVDVEQRLPVLAAYLGHAHVNDTYWYLTGTPELLSLASQRLEPFLGRGTLS